jgi:hypothetical protein
MSQHLSDLISSDDIKAFDKIDVRDLIARLEIDDSNVDLLNFVPPGRVSQAFINSIQPTTYIMGPLGGGKTTTCAFKRVYVATLAPIAWHPVDKKPTRMCRAIVLRDTFRSAEKTVLESWKQWFPKGFAGSTWTGGNDRPAIHTLRFMGRDGIRVEVVTEFAGLGENSIETLMKGREYSLGWLNEADTHADGALADMEQRVGRYPSAKILLTVDELEELGRKLGHKLVSGQRLALVLGDLNAPTLDNHVYRDFVKKKTPDRHLFIQPSGRSEEAENRFNLPADYYERIVRNQEEHFIFRMVDNKFGYSRHGKPVYEGFRRELHVARSRIITDPRLDLNIGIDISTNTLNPAAVIRTTQAPGRLAAIGELYLGHGVGAARFAEGLKRYLSENFSNASKLRFWLDPASEYGADKQGGQLSAMETMSLLLGFPMMIPANGSNELGMRLDAVKAELRGYLEPNTQMTICPERCPTLIEAYEGKYRFKRRKETASTEYEEEPEKTHPWSDLADADQYCILGVRGRTGAIRSAADREFEDKWSPRSPGSASSPWGGARGGFDPHKAGL